MPEHIKIPGYIYCAEHDIFYTEKLLQEKEARKLEIQKKYPGYPPLDIPACPLCKITALSKL